MSIQSNSKIKQIALQLMIRFDELAKPRITHKVVAWFWNTFFLSHARKAISEMQDEELKLVLKEGYDQLKPIFEVTKRGLEIKESRSLNSGKMQQFVEAIPENMDALELIPDA